MKTNTSFSSSIWHFFLALLLGLSAAGVSAREARATTFTVLNTNDSGADSIRQAIINANSNPGADTITFGISGTITLLSSLPHITDDVTINGSGQKIIINGNNHYTVFTIPDGKTVMIDSLTINNARNDSGGGAAIFNFGTLKVRNSTFTNNHANRGGAISNLGGTAWVVNSTFTNNGAMSGGAIYNYNMGQLIVVNSTFSDNSTSITGRGGAIYSWSAPNNLLHIWNNIMANSTAPQDCYSIPAPATDVNNLIESNYGCGISVSSADPMLGPLADNGGPTQTMALLFGSPAIDAGNDSVCDADPVLAVDQRGVTRPYGAHCDIGSYELKKGALTLRSTGANDGWILESTETSTAGGTLDGTSTTFHLGDEAGDKQYRAILSFNTAALPDTAVFTRVTLKIRKQGHVGTDPFTILGGLRVDISRPFFGAGIGLATNDFQADASQINVGTFRSTPTNNWYSAVIGTTGHSYINRTGSTQLRLRFVTDDNDNNNADYSRFYSGNFGTVTARPTLVIEYYEP